MPAPAPHIVALQQSTLAALLERLERVSGPVFAFHIGDLAWPPPAPLLEAAATLARDPAVYRYGHPQGDPALRTALAADLSRRHGLELGPDQLLITTGATGALSAACTAMLSPGDQVLMCAPHWPIVRGAVAKTGADPVEVDVSTQLYADPEASVADLLRPHLTSRTRAVYVTSPNNPDGKVWSAQQRQSLAWMAVAHDLWVLEDAAYIDLAFVPQPPPLASLAGMAERTAFVGCFSKVFAMPGMRVGWLAGPTALVTQAAKVAAAEAYHPPLLGQQLALAALGLPAEVRTQAKHAALERRNALVAALSPWPVIPPEGGAFVWLDLSERLGSRTARDLAFFLVDHGVVVAPGDLFGQRYGQCIRLNYTGMDPDQLTQGAALLRTLVDRFCANAT